MGSLPHRHGGRLSDRAGGRGVPSCPAFVVLCKGPERPARGHLTPWSRDPAGALSHGVPKPGARGAGQDLTLRARSASLFFGARRVLRAVLLVCSPKALTSLIHCQSVRIHLRPVDRGHCRWSVPRGTFRWPRPLQRPCALEGNAPSRSLDWPAVRPGLAEPRLLFLSKPSLRVKSLAALIFLGQRALCEQGESGPQPPAPARPPGSMEGPLRGSLKPHLPRPRASGHPPPSVAQTPGTGCPVRWAV